MALAVAAGAFGAHGLEGRLSAEALDWWHTAARYHAWHALCIGLVLFSGSLYLMALTGHRWLGAITPLGGTAWIVAWVVLATAAPSRQT
jgi:uncharacterized membrane protein YgdD (TMEM256/DUF423 family)